VEPHGRNPFSIVTDAVHGWLRHDAQTQGAALAFYTVFAMAPLLMLVVAVAGLVFDPEDIRGALMEQFRSLVGAGGAQAVETMLASANQSGRGIIASLISFALLVFTATSTLGTLRQALNRSLEAEPADEATWSGFIRARAAALAIIGVTGFLLVASLVVSTMISAFGGWIAQFLPAGALVLTAIEVTVSITLLSLLFAALFAILPDVRLNARALLLGGFVTAVLFNIGKYGIALYIAYADVTSGFGAGGAVILLFVWVYYSAQILLLGAEITAAYGRRQGDEQVRAQPSARGTP
jgi:membrane protein